MGSDRSARDVLSGSSQRGLDIPAAESAQLVKGSPSSLDASELGQRCLRNLGDDAHLRADHVGYIVSQRGTQDRSDFGPVQLVVGGKPAREVGSREPQGFLEVPRDADGHDLAG